MRLFYLHICSQKYIIPLCQWNKNFYSRRLSVLKDLKIDSFLFAGCPAIPTLTVACAKLRNRFLLRWFNIDLTMGCFLNSIIFNFDKFIDQKLLLKIPSTPNQTVSGFRIQHLAQIPRMTTGTTKSIPPPNKK